MKTDPDVNPFMPEETPKRKKPNQETINAGLNVQEPMYRNGGPSANAHDRRMMRQFWEEREE